jgi:choline dehydrogenase-like flavoprotein
VRFDYYEDLRFYSGSSWDRYFSSRADELLEYDVIVVGSGMGGGILANATSNAGLRTLVLEAGPIRHLVNITDLPLPNVVEAVDPYDLVGETRLSGGVCFNLGGRSVFWSAVIPRMRPWELRHWPAEIARYLEDEGGYDEAERLFRKRPATAYPEYQQKLLAEVDGAFGEQFEVTQLPRSYHVPDSGANQREGSPDERTTGVFCTAALLTDSVMARGLAGADRLHVAVEHLVDTVLFDGERPVGVEVLDLRQGARRTFRGKHIVLAGGTTESARLALTSRVRDDSGRLGQGLADHPEAELQFTPTRNLEKFSQGTLFLRPRSVPEGTDSFSCELALNWQYWDVHTPDDDRWREQHPADRPPRSTIKFLFRNGLTAGNQVTLDGGRYHVELAPMPQPLEREVIEVANQVLEYFGASEGASRLRYSPSAVTYHLGGSLRMGPDPSESVVDTDLKFHAYDNLWCCDLSVFPDIPASNPSLTLGALALRLAAHLRLLVRGAEPAAGDGPGH